MPNVNRSPRTKLRPLGVCIGYPVLHFIAYPSNFEKLERKVNKKKNLQAREAQARRYGKPWSGVEAFRQDREDG